MIDSLSELGDLLSPYYIGHSLVLLAYLPLRQFVLLAHDDARQMFGAGSGQMTEDFLTQEQEYLAVAFLTLFMKSRKVGTVHQLVSLVLQYGKLFVLIVLFKMHAWYLFAAYAALAAAAFMFLRAPIFSGHDEFEHFTRESFERLVRNPTLPKDRKVMWLVVFHADWCSKCTQLDPLFAKLSCKYSDTRRRWGKLDLEQFPELAKEFSVDLSEWKNQQLPTVIAIYKGKVQTRLPSLTKEGSVVPHNFSEQSMVRAFALDTDTASLRNAKKDHNDSLKQKRQQEAKEGEGGGGGDKED
mmetsp:Transcript_58619/g.100935  ORF Transcript_58619/g.100935 Transcript_58619/m.100935 type:complete len:298 (-) Transcript_58619:316-1209(-)